MNKPANDPASGDWLTISEAAARFAVSPRALRRAIERCQNVPETFPQTVQKTVHTKTGERSAAAFPLSFVERLAGEIRALATKADETVTGPGNVSQGEQERAGNVTENVPRNVPNVPAENAELLDQLRGEVSYLRAALEQSQANAKAALDKEQENTRAALDELKRANERAAVLIAAVGAGRLQLEPLTNSDAAAGSDAAHNVPHEASGAAERGETVEDAGTELIAEKTRPFWAFWRK